MRGQRNEQETAPLVGSINIVDATPAGGKAGILGSTVNLVNTIIGAGLLSVPFAFSMSGVALGIIFIVFIWFCSALSFDVLVRSAHLSGAYTYKEIALKTWGPSLAYFGELCILFYTFLNLVARPLTMAQYLTDVFSNIAKDTILTERWFIIIAVSVIMAPLTLLRNIDALKFSSFLSFICVLFVSAVVIAMLPVEGGMLHQLSQAHYWPDSASAMTAFGILVVSFCAHYNAPRMYQELQNRTPGRMRIVTMVSMTICLFLYASVGITGYLTCAASTNGNVLLDYPANSKLVTAARLALVVALIFSTPLVLFACRRSFLAVFLPKMQNDCPFWLWSLISISLIVVVGFIAYLLPSIDVVFSFSGSVIGVLFVYLIPGIFFVLLGRSRQRSRGYAVNDADLVDPSYSPSPLLLKVTGVFLIVCACLLGPLGTTGAVIRIINAVNSTSCATNITIPFM